jgi:cell division protein FtsW (lipid II flippase)
MSDVTTFAAESAAPPVPRSASPLARSRRSTELTLLFMAAVITGAAYTITALGTNAEIPPGIVVFVAMLLGLLLCAHVVVRLVARGADGTLLPLAALLHGIGFVMIARLDDQLAGLQATWSLVAIGAFIGTLLVVQRATDLARYRWLFFFAGAFLLLLPLAPGIGVLINGARIWVSIGPINFQPGEFAKIAFAIFFAAYLADRRELIAASTWRVGPLHLPEPRYIAPILMAWGFSVVVMVFQRDLGSSLLFFTLFVVMMWVATERVSYLLIGLVLFTGAAYFAWTQFGHVQRRVSVWLDPWADPLDSGYQVLQSLYGLADGGLTGTGLGRGNPGQIPLAENDFIFAAIGEEWGLLGGAAVLMAFILLVGAGLRIALRTDRTFEKLLAVGLTTIVGVQGFIIVAGVIKVVPLTGITLPFVSYGGSSLVSNYVLLALLIRLSDSSARRLGELPDEPTPSERWKAWRLSRRNRRAERRGRPVESLAS